MIASNAPENYVCPICLGVQEEESPDTLMRPSDIVYKDELITGFINSFFVGKNAGHVILVPNEHYESLYTLPTACGHRIFEVAQKIALYFHAIKTMGTMLSSPRRSAWPILRNAEHTPKRFGPYLPTRSLKRLFICY